MEEARDLLRQALASDEKSFEPGHPDIARSQSNLAMVLNNLGQLEEARDLLRKSYSAFLERLGPDHPHTKTAKNNLQNLPKQQANSLSPHRHPGACISSTPVKSLIEAVAPSPFGA